jgi:hypothetical protein
MQERKRQIFRNESWQRYLARQEATVFPRLVASRSLAALWLILALTLAASLLVLSREAPVYSSGVAVAVSGGNSPDGETVFVVLFPERDARSLRPGKAVEIEVAKEEAPITASVIHIETAPVSSADAMNRFGLATETLARIRFPASVAFAQPVEDMDGLLRAGNGSSGYTARVQHGSRRAISYLLSQQNNN